MSNFDQMQPRKSCIFVFNKSEPGYKVASGPRTTGDVYYESCIIGPEGIQIEITV